MSTVFQDVSPFVSQGHEVTALELLDAASQRLGELKDDPEVRMRFMNQIGVAYLDIDQYDKAASLLNKAGAIESQLHPNDRATLARTLISLASAERGRGNLGAAEQNYREAKRVLDDVRIATSAEYAKLLRSMGRLEHARGELKSAEHYYLESIAVGRRLNEDPLDIAISLRELASLYNWMNDLAAAERVGREALATIEASVPAQHPDRVLTEFVLGNIFFERGRINDAATLIERSVAAQRLLYRNSGPQLAQGLARLASLKEAQGKTDEAESLLRESLMDAQHALGDTHYLSGYYRTGLARLLVRMRRFDEAIEQLRTALQIFARTLPKQHQYVASAQYWLGEALLGSGNTREAVNVLRVAVETGRQTNAPEWIVARTENALGQALAAIGDRARAREYLFSSYERLRKERGTDDEATRVAGTRWQAFNSSHMPNK